MGWLASAPEAFPLILIASCAVVVAVKALDLANRPGCPRCGAKPKGLAGFRHCPACGEDLPWASGR